MATAQCAKQRQNRGQPHRRLGASFHFWNLQRLLPHLSIIPNDSEEPKTDESRSVK